MYKENFQDVSVPVHRDYASAGHEHYYKKPPDGRFAYAAIIFVISAGILVAGFFWLSSVFGRATVTIIPMSEAVALDDVFVAGKEKSKDVVPYQTMIIEEEESAVVPVKGVEKVSRKASGQIVVYNNYSSASQKLIAGTRFETPAGKIFKINQAITVPGITKVAGKSVPGSLAVTVYASEPGDAYNIGLSDFTLPGLKDGPRYEKVFARSKTIMAGGYAGDLKVASPEDILASKNKLRENLKNKIFAKAKLQTPDGFIMFEDAQFISFNDNSSEIGFGQSTTSLKLVMRGSLTSVIFNKRALAKFIAEKKIPSKENYIVHSNDLEKVAFKVIGKNGIDINSGKAFSFRLTGDTRIFWDIDTAKLKGEIAGLKKSGCQEVFKKYPTITSAETAFKPSWVKTFPEDLKKISIKVVEK